MSKQKLSIHPLGNNYESDVWIEYEFTSEHYLKFSFSLPAQDFKTLEETESLFQKKSYKGNWGLWEKKAVLELYLQKRVQEKQFEAPYLEFQISPEEEYFLAKVHTPRLVYSSYLELPIKSRISEENKKRVNVSVELDLSYACLGSGQWYGNFYMILPPRSSSKLSTYAGLQLDEKKLDFHLPRIFKRL